MEAEAEMRARDRVCRFFFFFFMCAYKCNSESSQDNLICPGTKEGEGLSEADKERTKVYRKDVTQRRVL